VDDSQCSYLFSPLETVDAASLTRLAEELNSSPSKPKRAVSSFLLRYVESVGSAGKKSGQKPGVRLDHGLSDLKSTR
jgi:hypothetical protein